MVNASLANPTTTGKCGCNDKYYWAALPSNVTFCIDDKLTSQMMGLWPNGFARSR